MPKFTSLSRPNTSSLSHYTELDLGQQVKHEANHEKQGGGDDDEALPRPVLPPSVVPPVLFRHRSTHVAFVAVAREPVHLHVAVLPLLVHS